jgi:biotin carboxyl carrier protein
VATVTQIGPGVFRVDDEGRQAVVYVAGTADDMWAFYNGDIYRERERVDHKMSDRAKARGGDPASYRMAAPMPATVVRVLVSAGQSVRKGDTLVLLEAMKMELPIRAPADAVVKAVNCREGELVQPDVILVDLA